MTLWAENCRRVVMGACAWAAAAWLLATPAAAQETAAYPNGTSGIKAGTVPPPGHYWLCYNRIYTADELRDANSNVTTAVCASAPCSPMVTLAPPSPTHRE